ncbi:uncharacterized protein LOC134230866 [Saccostrea cucullata]|uniref:uncharacterized protein LOC134230866 n=1 Tax=Saccostrea cuccullata TaxID=36930 RepID=UPI002ED15097
MYLQDEHKCKECEGFFGVNCSEECLAGYYGKQCREKCNCDVSQCDSVLGCLTNKSEKYDLKGNQRTKLGSFLHITIPALLATVVLLVGCFGIIYRCTIIYVRQVPAAADTTTSMEIEEDDTSSTYASVNRLSRRAVKVTGIQQNSRTHGNTLFIEATNQAHAGSLNLRTDHSLSYKSKQNAEDLNDPYSTCLEVEELYDDTACSALSGQYVPQRGLSSDFEDSSSGNSDFPDYNDVLQENERHEH